MRIAVVNPFHYPFMGGIEHRIHHVGRRLGRRHEITVFTGRLPGTAETEQMDGYVVRRFRSAYFNVYNPPIVLTTGIREGLRDLRPDIIELHYRWAGSYTRAVMSQDCPKVFIWHNSYGEGEGGMKPLSLLNDLVFTRHLRRLDRLVCVSEFLASELLQRGWPKDLISVVPNGVDMPENLGEEKDFILFVGRLVKTKGIPYLLKAMRSIDQKLVICGSGPEREGLERLASDLGVEDKVKFMGRVSEETKHQLQSTCKLLVMPSTIEAYGIVAAEGMSYGKPVVASRIGGLPEVVGDGGILTEPRDSRSLEEAINRLLSDESLRRRIGERARRRAMEFSWDKTADAMERIYMESV